MDQMKITVAKDGTIKTETDRISAPNHSNAESLLNNMAKDAGGKVQRTRKAGHSHGHVHSDHTHQH